MIWYLLCLFLYVNNSFCVYLDEKPCVVVITSYNNMKWYEKNLDSVRTQQYSNYRVVYIDDCSTDGTADAVEAYIRKWNLHDRFMLVRNTTRRGQLYNLYSSIHCLTNNVIVLTLDGDDWFAHDAVLSLINNMYDEDILMTYGQFKEDPSGKIGFCKEIPDVVKEHAAYRYYGWITSHLRTFYAGLFKEIPVGCFIRGNDFIRAACDHAFMFPLLELSGGRAAFVDEVVYVYNMANSNSVFRKNVIQQLSNAHWIRGRESLRPLKHDPRIVDLQENGMVYNIHFSTGSFEACVYYLKSLAVAHINPAAVTVVCEAYSIEAEKMYKALCATYGVSCCVVNNVSSCTDQMHAVCKQFCKDTFILLTGDGCVWTHGCDLHAGITLLQKTKALGYYYAESSGNSVAVKPHFISVFEEYFVWKYAENEGAWHMTYSTHAVLYLTDTMRVIFDRINADSVRDYVQALTAIPSLYPDNVGACNMNFVCVYKRGMG